MKNTGLILVNHTRGLKIKNWQKYKQWLQLAKWEELLCKGNGNVTVSLITSTLFLLISANLLHLLLSKQNIKNVLFSKKIKSDTHKVNHVRATVKWKLFSFLGIVGQQLDWLYYTGLLVSWLNRVYCWEKSQLSRCESASPDTLFKKAMPESTRTGITQ